MTSDSRLHDQPLSALYSVSVRAVPSISNRSHRIQQQHQQQQRSLQTTADTQRIRSIKYSRPESMNGDVDGAMDTPRHCSTNSSTPLRPSRSCSFTRVSRHFAQFPAGEEETPSIICAHLVDFLESVPRSRLLALAAC